MTVTGRCAYLGPRGTFCEQAVGALHPDGELEPVACASIAATLDAVHSHTAERAVVPIESSVEGGVNATLDELAAGPQLLIKAEVIVPGGRPCPTPTRRSRSPTPSWTRPWPAASPRGTTGWPCSRTACTTTTPR